MSHTQTPAPQAESSVSGAGRRSGPDPEKTYHGRPCKNCGETLRYHSNHSCVACSYARDAARRATPQYREYQRLKKAEHRNANRAEYNKYMREYKRGYEMSPEQRERQRAHSREYARRIRNDPASRSRKNAYHRRWYHQRGYLARLRKRAAEMRLALEQQLLEVQEERRRLEEVIANGG